MKRPLAVVTMASLVVASLSGFAGSAGAAAPIREPYGPSSAGGSIAGSYPAGVACPFAVSFEIVSGGTGQQWTFLDQAGELVRIQNRVGPSTWMITNLDSGETATISLPAGFGSIRFASDGTATVTISGGVIGFNAPTDTPPGPFSLAISGRVVFIVAPDGTGTLAQLSGDVTSLCDLVS